MYYVYSIRKDALDCPLNNGYIGATKNFTKRHREHFHANAGNPSPFRGEDINDWHFELLAICETKQQALTIEGLYRPDAGIGLNKLAGGSHAGNQKLTGRPSNNPSIDDDAIAQILQWKSDKYAPTVAMQAEILGCSVKTVSNYRNA